MNQINRRIQLATDRDRAQGGARQAHPCVLSKLAATLSQLAGVDVKAVLQVENRLEASAQVFLAFNAPLIGGQVSALHRNQGGVTHIVVVRQCVINFAVKRDTALGLGDRSCGQHGQGKTRNCETSHKISKIL